MTNQQLQHVNRLKANLEAKRSELKRFEQRKIKSIVWVEFNEETNENYLSEQTGNSIPRAVLKKVMKEILEREIKQIEDSFNHFSCDSSIIVLNPIQDFIQESEGLSKISTAQ
jgi:hypothetical protein